jgi:hypothetical protein
MDAKKGSRRDSAEKDPQLPFLIHILYPENVKVRGRLIETVQFYHHSIIFVKLSMA